MDALILAGGKGTRLASVVSDLPKPMAPVNGMPFLNHILDQIEKSGFFSRIILSVGHLSEKIIEYYALNPRKTPVIFVKEDAPLGTGGAILHASKAIESDSLFVFNGDSITKTDFHHFFKQHQNSKMEISILLNEIENTARYGTVRTQGQKIISFLEKVENSGKGLINTGTYLINRSILTTFPEGRSSLETDILPKLVLTGQVGGYQNNGPFLDMGIPESYKIAPDFMKVFYQS